jgi:molybdopterin-guanine dinucleotide biosynthesis protein A
MPDTFKNIACAILAGGKNSRMGGMNKGFIKIDNSYIIENITTEVEKIFKELIIVTNSAGIYDSYRDKYFLISDIIKDIGPLGGIYTALDFTKSDAVFFVPCDMPFINHIIIESILKSYNETGCEAVVPRFGEIIQPLFSLFKKDVKDKLFSFINSGHDYSVKIFLKQIEVYYLDMEINENNKKVFININSQADLENLKRNIV